MAIYSYTYVLHSRFLSIVPRRGWKGGVDVHIDVHFLYLAPSIRASTKFIHDLISQMLNGAYGGLERIFILCPNQEPKDEEQSTTLCEACATIWECEGDINTTFVLHIPTYFCVVHQLSWKKIFKHFGCSFPLYIYLSCNIVPPFPLECDKI